MWSTTSATCDGESGAGLVEPGSRPIVVGLVSVGNAFGDCTRADPRSLEPNSAYPEGYILLGADVYLGSTAALRFIHSR